MAIHYEYARNANTQYCNTHTHTRKEDRRVLKKRDAKLPNRSLPPPPTYWSFDKGGGNLPNWAYSLLTPPADLGGWSFDKGGGRGGGGTAWNANNWESVPYIR